MSFSTIRFSAVAMLAVLLALFSAQAYAIDLAAVEYTKRMPDGSDVKMWGYKLANDCWGDSDPVACALALRGQPTSPGPRLRSKSSNFRIRLINTLSTPTSIVLAGQSLPTSPGCQGPVKFIPAAGGTPRVRSFVCEALPEGTQEYTWSNAGGNSLKPGSYAYHSGTHPQVQVQMGLYGGLQRDASRGVAYDGVPYDNQIELFFSEVDPALHEAVAPLDDLAEPTYGQAGVGPTSTLNYRPTHFLMHRYFRSGRNRKGVPDATIDPARNRCIGGAVVGERTLIRLYNMGLRELAPMMVGGHFDIVAEGGNVYPYARTQYQTLLMPGSSKDLIWEPESAGRYPLIDRRLHLTDQAGSGSVTGGMKTCFTVRAAPAS